MDQLMVMTGATRGIGQVAAALMAGGLGGIAGARDPAALPAAWQHRPLDLASLSSVRGFVASLPDAPITHLVLNAGGQRSDVAGRTIDGFETTFATNHLAHYLLLRLVMPRLAKGARVVITTSGTHDPAQKTAVPAPRHANAAWLANPDRDPGLDRSPAVAGMRAYSASKLCNLMTARQLAASAEAIAGGWHVFAYDPGLTPGTGLVRSHPWAVRRLVWPLLPLLVPIAKGMNTLADAGRGLADLATTTPAPIGHVYASLRKGRLTWPDPSELARDDHAVAALWHDSAELAGL